MGNGLMDSDRIARARKIQNPTGELLRGWAAWTGLLLMGVLPLPKVLLSSLSRIITETIAEAPERLEEAVEITYVEVGEGTMRIGGRITTRTGR